jgi:hypothetical protein
VIKNSLANLYITMFVCLLWGCVNTASDTVRPLCLPDVEIMKGNGMSPIIYVDRMPVVGCIYELGSGYLDNSTYKKLAFDGTRVFVNLVAESEDFKQLVTFKDSIGQTRTIRIMHRDWEGGNGESLIVKSYQVEVLKKVSKGEENFIVFKIKYLISAFPEYGTMDGVLFFSDIRGFVGSHYFDPHTPLTIIENSGYILDDLIDYSKFSFARLR